MAAHWQSVVTARALGTDRTLPVVEESAVEDLMAERRRRFGTPGLPVATVRRMVTLGWTAATYSWLETAGAHAHARHAGPSWPTSVPSSGRLGVDVVGWRTVLRAEETAEFDVPFTDLWPWISAWVSVTDVETWILVNEGIRSWRSGTLRVPPRSWVRRVGPLGALAWLAGLSLREAAAMRRAHRLDEATLRGLAAVRGVVLPPAPR
jgi:hypothetical protein